MEDERAFESFALVLDDISVLIGQVPVIDSPAVQIAVNIVSHPLEVCNGQAIL
jgi:hypothetical protein